MDRRTLSGYLLAATSAITFSAKGIFVKVIYGYGVDPVTLLALRFVLAMPFFWAAVFFFPSGKVGRKDALILVLSGLLGLYLAALADFWGLLYIDASLERVILYTYPAMVVLLSSIFFKERLGGKKVFSIAMTYAGLFIALKLYKGGVSAHNFGAALIIFSAIVYSFSYILTQVLGKRISGVKISAYSTTAATFAFLASWHGKTVPQEPEVWGLILLLAFFSTFVPVLTLALGIKRIGASRAALVSFIGPVSTAILAHIILGESLDAVQLGGMGLVIAGVLLISSEKPEEAEAKA